MNANPSQKGFMCHVCRHNMESSGTQVLNHEWDYFAWGTDARMHFQLIGAFLLESLCWKDETLTCDTEDMFMEQSLCLDQILIRLRGIACDLGDNTLVTNFQINQSSFWAGPRKVSLFDDHSQVTSQQFAGCFPMRCHAKAVEQLREDPNHLHR